MAIVHVHAIQKGRRSAHVDSTGKEFGGDEHLALTPGPAVEHTHQNVALTTDEDTGSEVLTYTPSKKQAAAPPAAAPAVPAAPTTPEPAASEAATAGEGTK